MEATPRPPSPERGRAGRFEPTGWTMFAAFMLFLAGWLDALWGFAAILNNDIVTVGGEGVIVWDVTAWGWFHLIVGVVLLLTAGGLWSMQTWARWTAVVLATLSAILQVGMLPAFPVWALIIIALDVIVIYGLTARWEERPLA